LSQCSVIAVLVLAAFASAQISCLSNDGKPVDWFFVMKMPKPVGEYEGYTAAYLDSTNPDLSALSISNFHYATKNAVATTVKQLGIYGGHVDKREQTLGWAFWNDETYLTFASPKPVEHWNNSEGYNYGHTKGLMAFHAASKKGFYLQHSAPAFPYAMSEAPDYFHFPYGQAYFAQHFFCVSLGADQIEAASKVARYFNAFVYDSNVPSSIASKMPNFAALTRSEYKNGSLVGTITSLGGQKFTFVGKDGDQNGDLYEDFVCPALNVGLTSDTWCCGTFDPFCCMPSYCKGAPIKHPSGPQKGKKTYAFDSTNIHDVNFGSGLAFNVSWNHAKFGIADQATAKAPWLCFADMNRMTSQRVRGGGALCFEHTKFYATMTKVVTQFDHCGKENL